MTWFDKDPERLQVEAVTLGQRFPEAQIVIKDGRASIFYALPLYDAVYGIEVQYQPDHPFTPPRGFVREPRLRWTGHTFFGGEVCAYGAKEVSSRTSGHLVLEWVVLFLMAYEVWTRRGGTLPGSAEAEQLWRAIRSR
jgi:hypothetical protein